jgi:acyl carrier protein
MTTADVYGRLTVIRDLDHEQLTAAPAITANDLDSWDSPSNLRLMMSVGEQFGIKLTASEIGKLKSVGALADLVFAKTPS